MARQLPSSPSSKKVSELIGLIKRGELILQPEFQRKLVWNASHKEAFIQTILLGFPFPEIYIAQSGIDVETLQTQQVVVDGQQRLTTIIQYTEGTSDFGKLVPPYKDLENTQKQEFLNYNVVIRDLQDISSEDIKEVFKRINQTKFNLEQVEIQNAFYDGEFITTAKEIIESGLLSIFPIFYESEISRMGDLHFILLAMATFEEGGYFAGNSKTEDYIIKYNDHYPNLQNTKESFFEVLSTIGVLDLPDDSIWFRKSNFFTLLMEALWDSNIISNESAHKIRDFESLVLQNKDNSANDFGKYYTYMYTGTNSRTARVERGRILCNFVYEDV